jgi:aminoglycoside phosphotransferase (APT) family kinase protein
VWADNRLIGFIDWDFAGPVYPDWDLAFAAFSWVPLHARHLAAAEGFTDFAARPCRLRRFLHRYRYAGRPADLVDQVRARASEHAAGIRRLADAGDPYSPDSCTKAWPPTSIKPSPNSPSCSPDSGRSGRVT